ncbi:MAG TPA: GNAT family acetyltransferase [Polyangiales bacterium]|nr:GNAT family acetyltransferase [Polyangiales bacterium]
MKLEIRAYGHEDEDSVVALWNAAGLTRPWNDPRRDIARKLRVQPELFQVGELAGRIVASVMAGYDGHRGWIYYLGVDPAHQRQGFARAMMARAEELLLAMGCPKVDLMVRTGNESATEFYARIGYVQDPVTTLSKRLIADDH